MTGWAQRPLRDLIDATKKPRLAETQGQIWILNLDQIEAGSGRIRHREMVATADLGPSTYPFEVGTVLYSKLRPYLNKVAVADAPGVATTELVPIRCDEKSLLPEYLAYFLRTPAFVNYASSVVAGAKMPRMVMSQFWAYEIPVPPLPEQRRIAAILNQADALRAKRREALAQLDSLTQSIFIEMFGDSLRSEERHALADLVEEFRYGTSNKSGNNGYPALRIPNVTSGSLDLTELKTVEVDDAEFERLRLLEGDLLFVRTNGNPDYVGRCAAFIPSDLSSTAFKATEFIYASYLIRARLKSEKILPVILQEYLSTAEGRQALRARSKTSAGQFNINTEALGALPIPSFPKAMQETFIRRKQTIQRQQATQRASLAELNALFASLQHRAFAGQL